MGGINEIAEAFRKAAGPGLTLKAARMSYDNETGEQVFEFDVVDKQGARTVVDRVGPHLNTVQMVDRVGRVARGEEPPNSLPKIAPVTPSDPRPAPAPKLKPKPQPRMPNLGPKVEAAGGGGEQIGIPIQTLMSSAPEIEHQGETYELAHDGSPQTLFF